MPADERPDIRQAQQFLRGEEAGLEELRGLTKRLKNLQAFGYARQICARARTKLEINRDPQLRLWFAQQHALCTSKDRDLTEDRHSAALDILAEVEDLKTTAEQESLGIAGGILKRRWEAFAQIRDLHLSLAYYLRGYNVGIDQHDYGYTAINAAYVLDLIAWLESQEETRTGERSSLIAERREQARRIREHVVSVLPPMTSPDGSLQKQWWFLVTVAEAYFGLQRYGDALEWLQLAAGTGATPEWEFETTARQLASLARLQVPAGETLENSPAWETVAKFLGPYAGGVRSAFVGKIGLALSGGGFRASLFHIGLLARLAELDVLRSVEFLSCVSGGSIIGAYYYLEVRRLLESKADAEITREDYIEIVQRIEREFLAGVQRNLRNRVGLSPGVFLPGRSRSLAIGRLYETELYSRVNDGGQYQPRWLNELFVYPKGEGPGFNAKYNNWRRQAKVPILVLNATTLNTGHNWQFTASWMGEPPAGIDTEIDGNYRLRRMYYWQAPKRHQRVRLGTAVGASACVPGLFDPIVFKGLYPDRDVKLVDGGVHDNQGVSSLLEQNCNVLLVSDASGQMEAIDQPVGASIGVLLRSQSVMGARARQAQYHELDARRRGGLLQGLLFIHLKKDLDVDPVDWVDSSDLYAASSDARPSSRRGVLTKYGILKDVQQRLSAIRTDLDSFNDVEAYALMSSAYRQAEYEFARCVPTFPKSVERRASWRFQVVEPPMKAREGMEDAYARLLHILEVGHMVGGKVWKLSAGFRATVFVLLVAALVAAGYVLYRIGVEAAPAAIATVGFLVLALLCVLLVARVSQRVFHSESSFDRWVAGFFAGLAAFPAAALYLTFFDRLYLRFGLVEPLGSKVTPPGAKPQGRRRKLNAES
jgi:predicted acylesterase/phospholipase RssA